MLGNRGAAVVSDKKGRGQCNGGGSVSASFLFILLPFFGVWFIR